MRTVELAKVAAAAEALRLRRIARRQGVRVGFAAVSAVFAIAVLIVIHVVVWHLLLRSMTPVQASLVLLAIDAVLAGVFAFLAFRNAPDSIEAEAMQIRQQALVEMRQSLTFMGILASTTGIALRRGVRLGARQGATHALANLATRLVGR